jgi:squalene-hopene/tetraprenyl-beta-curcumene cyclase
MNRLAIWSVVVGSCLSLEVASTRAAEPITLDNVVSPAANSPDEPLAKKFSFEAATSFLDSAALAWQKERKCMTCHTNYAFLYARPAIAIDTPSHKTVRAYAEEIVTERWIKQGPRWDAEVVATAAALAFNDSSTTGKLHPTTKTALDKMWTLQQPDGGWKWLKCDWPPMESDDHYGVTLAAIAVGVAPDKYADTEAAKHGLDGIRRYLKVNPAPTVHHQAMILWAASYVPDLLSANERKAIADKLVSLQKPDGGWCLATLGDWKRADETESQDTTHSDGYATVFVIYVLRRTGVPADNPNLKRGVEWLKQNQRESGRWFTRSLHKDNKHFISHAGTAFAVMALAECGETEAKTVPR